MKKLKWIREEKEHNKIEWSLHIGRLMTMRVFVSKQESIFADEFILHLFVHNSRIDALLLGRFFSFKDAEDWIIDFLITSGELVK